MAAKKLSHKLSLHKALSRKKIVSIFKSKQKKLKKAKVYKITLAFTIPGLIAYMLVVVGLFGGAYFTYKLADGLYYSVPPIELPVPVSPIEIKSNAIDIEFRYSPPTKIAIPMIDVNTSIIELDRQSDGTMQTPDYYSGVVGWYKYSPTPGEVGPSIIVGHVGNKKGPSVFWNLGKLSIGETISIERADGKLVTFVVTEKQQYDIGNFPTEKVYGDTIGPELRLITCGGNYDKLQSRYSHNTVIYAKSTAE